MLGIVEPGRQPTGETSQMHLGSVVHKILEGVGQPSRSVLQAAGVGDLGALFDSREWRDLTEESPERELPFIMHIAVGEKDCWIRGRMDAVVLGSENGGDAIPRVVDYKYATWRDGGEDAYEIQMSAYALALMKSLDAERAIAELWYLKPPLKIVRREYARDEAEDKMRSLLAKYLDATERNEWPPAERAHCDRVECGFREQCWSVT